MNGQQLRQLRDLRTRIRAECGTLSACPTTLCLPAPTTSCSRNTSSPGSRACRSPDRRSRRPRPHSSSVSTWVESQRGGSLVSPTTSAWRRSTGSSPRSASRDVVAAGPEQLTAVARQEAPGVWRLLQLPSAGPAVAPGAADQLAQRPEARRRAARRARHGRPRRPAVRLRQVVRRAGAGGPSWPSARDRGVPLRVLTTTYMGATDRTALDRLVRDFGAEVKVNYETRSTRLHAKAWLFRRNSGYDTAYVGSSNLSRAALLDGLEWNVRLAGSHTPELLAQVRGDLRLATGLDRVLRPVRPGHRRASGSTRSSPSPAARGRATARPSRCRGLEVRPYPHQQEILDQLAGRARGARPPPQPGRRGDRHRQDRRRGAGLRSGCARDGRDPACCSSRTARRSSSSPCAPTGRCSADGAFGELYVGGERPERWRHVFASVQSLSAYGVDRLPADQFDVVVDRRVPPRRGGDVPPAARPPAPAASCSG